MTLPTDSTIASVYEQGSLIDPKRYVGAVLDKMRACHTRWKSANVCIGIFGEGKGPNYRVEHPLTPTLSREVYGAYHGFSHGDLPNHEKLDESNWSKEVMNLAEVEALLRRIEAEISN